MHVCLLMSLLGLLVSVVQATGDPQLPPDFAEASLEELLRIRVTSVSKKEQKLWKTAAAIFVVTQEDIRRSGVTSIPELLRMVPGLHVARITSNRWSISARGFSGRHTDKLLVMIDGRSIYSPVYGGVDWNLHDLLLEDVERIEVIRGPGATMWGANAVNGVIHIITKSAQNTAGGLVTGGGGTEDRRLGALRYGGRIGQNASYRAYTKYFEHGPLQLTSGGDAPDDWRFLRSGFRLDWNQTPRDLFTLQGDLYNGTVHVEEGYRTLSPPFRGTVSEDAVRRGGNLLGRWRQTRSEKSELTLQLYYDRVTALGTADNAVIDIGDVDFQHRFRVNKRHEILWGAGYRSTTMRTDNDFSVTYTPGQRTDALVTSFVQDEIGLIEGRLWLTVGTKAERNAYTGGEIQPGVRLLWTPSDRQSVWATFARAISTPTRTRHDIRINTAVFPTQGGGLGVVSIFGSEDYRSPAARTHEFGYRLQPTGGLSFDLASFYTAYRRLQTLDSDSPYLERLPSPPPHTVFPTRFGNKMSGETYGAEVVANWSPIKRWKLAGSYSWLRIQAHRDPDSRDDDAESIEGNSPRHQASIRSLLNLNRRMEFDTSAYYVSSLTTQNIPAYLRVDARLGWRTPAGLELSVGVQNLLDNRHPEFFPSDARTPLTEVGRSVHGRIVWRFSGGR